MKSSLLLLLVVGLLMPPLKPRWAPQLSTDAQFSCCCYCCCCYDDDCGGGGCCCVEGTSLDRFSTLESAEMERTTTKRTHKL